MKPLAKMEKLESRVSDLDLRIEVLEAKCRSQGKSTGELKASANFIKQKF